MKPVIPNHISGRLSELDMQIVHAVPPGGNWKNIPESVPSKRLEQIRISFKEGKGSRSTYYGRLLPSMPCYTINTYFNRPGNGCHIHYSQDRVLSQREAARLQSFRDDFVFFGTQGAINTQIGNAVPPLLAYQIAKSLGKPGYFVDLFCGAGGLGLGFKWAGWKPIVANDIEKYFLQTYAYNVHDNVVLGSITSPEVFDSIVENINNHKSKNINAPLWILGGPPCQGFSTAGHKRTMDDERNHLFMNYKNLLEVVKPDGFIFENVPGLLNMQGGSIFQYIKDAFSSVMPSICTRIVSTEEFAIPQRRKRLLLIGNKSTDFEAILPKPITSLQSNLRDNLFYKSEAAVSVDEALSDLPSLDAGEDGTMKSYQFLPRTSYQAFIRGVISPAEYLERIKSNNRCFSEGINQVIAAEA